LQKIINWFSRKRQAMAADITYLPLLKQFRIPEYELPRKKRPYELYMKRPDVRQRIADVFAVEGYHDHPKRDHVSLWCTIAKNLLAEEPDSVKEAIGEEAESLYQAETARFEEETEGLPSADPEAQREYAAMPHVAILLTVP
jgi:hypothetical protein